MRSNRQPIHRRIWPFVVLGLILVVVAMSVLAQVLISPGTGHPASPVPQAALRLIRTVDDAELCAHGATGSFISNLEDLNALSGRGLLIQASEAHLAVQVAPGQSGKSYFVRVTGRDVDTYIERSPNFIDYGESRRLSNRCPYPISTAKRRLNG